MKKNKILGIGSVGQGARKNHVESALGRRFAVFFFSFRLCFCLTNMYKGKHDWREVGSWDYLSFSGFPLSDEVL
jgi:hypothetical protein